MTSSLWNWLLFTLIQRDKVKWVCVTLNEGYLISANRGSNNSFRILIKTKQISLQWKDEFVGQSFLLFLDCRPTAVFWQSASYVQSFCADQCIHCRECWVVSLKLPSRGENRTKKNFFLNLVYYGDLSRFKLLKQTDIGRFYSQFP